MKLTHYIFVLGLCLLSTNLYSDPYTRVSMRSTSVLMPASNYSNGASRYGRYQTTTPKPTYTRSMMRTGSRLLSTSLDSVGTRSSIPHSIGGSAAQGFTSLTVRPALRTDGTAVSPIQFSSMANSRMALLNTEGDEDRGDPTGGGAGTPGQITDENDQSALPVGEGMSVLLTLAGAWSVLLIARRRRQQHVLETCLQ